MFKTIRNYFSKDSEALDTKNMADADLMLYAMGLTETMWSKPVFTKSALEGYNNNPIAYRTINIRGDAIGSLRWTVYNKKGDPIPNHPLQRLINQPNPGQSQSEFMSSLSKNRDLGGDGFVWANRSGPDGRPSELTLLRPDHVQKEFGQNGQPIKYTFEYGNDSESAAIDQITGESDVLQWMHYNPLDEHRGLSPLAACFGQIDTFNEATMHTKKLLVNGATLGGIVSTEQSLTPEQRTFLAKQIKKNHAGGKNAGKTMFMEKGMSFKKTAQSLKELTLIELQTELSRNIAQAMSVPDQMIGIPGSSTFANFAEARIYFVENTLIPMAESLQECLNYWLVPMFAADGKDIVIKYNEDSIPGLEIRRAELYTRLEGTTFLTINEKRDQVGLEPVTGGDELNTNTPTNEDTTTVDNGDEE